MEWEFFHTFRYGRKRINYVPTYLRKFNTDTIKIN